MRSAKLKFGSTKPEVLWIPREKLAYMALLGYNRAMAMPRWSDPHRKNKRHIMERRDGQKNPWGWPHPVCSTAHIGYSDEPLGEKAITCKRCISWYERNFL